MRSAPPPGGGAHEPPDCLWAAPEPADTEGAVAVLVLGVDAGVVAVVVGAVLGDALSEQAAAVVATVLATPWANEHGWPSGRAVCRSADSSSWFPSGWCGVYASGLGREPRSRLCAG